MYLSSHFYCIKSFWQQNTSEPLKCEKYLLIENAPRKKRMQFQRKIEKNECLY